MATSATVAKWRKDPTVDQPDRIYIEYGDGSGRNFINVQAAQVFVDQQLESNIELARLFALTKCVKLDPTVSSPTAVEGKTLTIDVTAGNVVKFA